MKTREFRRQLSSLGARFVEGSRHTRVYLNGRQSTVPRHREISEQLVLIIRKQLGLP